MSVRCAFGEWVLGWMLVASLSSASKGAAQAEPYIHVVRPNETLASIAQQYYGDPRHESTLVAENGLDAVGGAAIVVGMRLLIPHVHHHRVQEGETWAQLAERFYGNEERLFLLLEINNGTAGDQPDVGAELVVPYPLRHTADQNESLRQISKIYYGNERSESIRRLRRFNEMRGMRPARGQVVLVPLANLALSDEGRQLIQQATGETVSAGEIRALQQAIDEELPQLREFVRRGRFTEAVSTGNRLLGSGQLSGNQIVTIQTQLGTAYVALDRADLAVQAFRVALRLQPDLDLDVARTSPTVMRAFRQAQEEEGGEVPDGGAADAGSEDAGTSDNDAS